MKLTEKSTQVLDYVKANGGHVSIAELCTAFDRAPRSMNATVTDLTKKEFAVREKIETEDGEIVYVNITELGKEYVPTED